MVAVVVAGSCHRHVTKIDTCSILLQLVAASLRLPYTMQQSCNFVAKQKDVASVWWQL